MIRCHGTALRWWIIVLCLTGCGATSEEVVGLEPVKDEAATQEPTTDENTMDEVGGGEAVIDESETDESEADANATHEAGGDAGGGPVTDESVGYESVPANVNFGDVRELVFAEPDERIRYGEDSLQFVELTRPREGGKSAVVVFLHGGCWLNSFGLDHTRAVATALAQEGFAVWNLEYRRTGDDGGGWPGSLMDIQAGIRRLAEVEDASLDLSRVVLAGHSAGGHLALLAGHWLTTEPIDGLDVRGVVGLAAIVDLATYAMGPGSCEQAAAQFMGFPPQERPELYAQANPADLSMHPNSLLIQGRADQIVPEAQARTSGLPVEWVDGAGHFDLIHPGTPAWGVVVAALRRVTE